MGPEDIGLMLIDVKVRDVWQGGAGSTVTVLFDWAENSPTPASEMAKAFPKGTKVAVFGDPSSWPRPKDAPTDSAVIETSAEGLMVQTEGDGFAIVWGDQPSAPGWKGIDTFSELEDALDVPSV